MKLLVRLFAVVILTLCRIVTGPQKFAKAQFPPAAGTGPGLPETVEAIERARVTTRILYVTAHPDDESSAVLTYLARGLHADVALLSLTRGEGGQNDLGPEQAPQLGVIRTDELLAATRGYGVKLYFTRAKDFGFSKTPEETEKVWGEQVLDDLVRVIRMFRPHVILNGWGGVHTGHGHHQASGLLTPKAVQLARDPSFQLRGPASEKKDLLPWGGRKPVVVLDLDRGEKPQGYVLPLDETSPLYGKTWREIGLDAFTNHRSQGIAVFLGSPFLRRPIALKREDGGELNPGLLAQPLGPLDEDYEEGNMGVDPLMRAVDSALVEARDAALRLDWKAATSALVEAGRKLNDVPKLNPTMSNPEPLLSLARSTERKREKVGDALRMAAGLRLDATADRSEIVPGETFTLRVDFRHREGIGGDFKKPSLRLPPEWSVSEEEPESANVIRFTVKTEQKPPRLSDGPAAALLPEPPPLMTASEEAVIDGYSFTVTSAVTSVRTSSSRVDRMAPQVVPAYTLAVEPKQDLENLTKPRKPFDVLLRVHSYATELGQVRAGVVVPKGWKASVPVTLKFSGTGDRYARLTVTPPQKLAAGHYKITAYAERAPDRSRGLKADRSTLSLEPLPSLPTHLWSEPAECVVHAFGVAAPQNLRVGYVTAEGEPIPDALRRLGIQVDMLDAKDLAFGDLSRFRAIVVGVRAYELRPELPGANQRLLDYVSNGGTLVVQYNRDFIWDKLEPAPYPALISPPLPPAKDGAPPTPRPLPRITDENSPVKFLKPNDPLLNMPNKITQEDFKGWVQERGLYFWTQFDPKYTPLLAMNDPGEPELNGGLVYGHYGKGTYIFTGLAFFRQLPDGVPGAYRLFVNLLSASRAK
ncbi:MAG TPA: PIG-L family deacetylase [Candidatus Dormibacteraeota bacterium]|nr:PIG-L family deacetylase [Candidatus Dormibacteraeota bacterium]